MKKISLLIFLLIFVLSGCGVVISDLVDQKPIGGGKDEHGCLVAAGYIWCEAKQECLRVWEDWCEDETLDIIDSLTDITGVELKSENNKEIKWRLEIGDKVEEMNLDGKVFTGNLLYDQYEVFSEYFRTNFEEDVHNMADGVMGSLVGYKRGYTACTLQYQFISSTISKEGPIVPDTSSMDVEINCGLFNPNWISDKEVPADSEALVYNFETCVSAGNSVMESYPRQCRHGDNTFTEEIKIDLN